MKCPKCQTENKENARFCRNCGNEFILVCPECGSQNLHGDNFCDQCRHNLKQYQDDQESEPFAKPLSFDDKIEKIQKYLPKGIIDKVLSHLSKIEGEKKEFTVMFCDMAGFTPLVEKIGAERAYAVMDQIY